MYLLWPCVNASPVLCAKDMECNSCLRELHPFAENISLVWMAQRGRAIAEDGVAVSSLQGGFVLKQGSANYSQRASHLLF